MGSFLLQPAMEPLLEGAVLVALVCSGLCMLGIVSLQIADGYQRRRRRKDQRTLK